MHNDTDTNYLAVSSTLFERYPVIANTLKSACEKNKITFESIESVNPWCRDWMPVQTANGFTKFRYGYGEDNSKHANLRVRTPDWNWLKMVFKTPIRLDGGNIVYHDGKAIMTDIVFRHNRDVKRLIPKLESMLDAAITVVPTEPGDDIGHTDGICKFTPDGKLLVHDYRKAGMPGYCEYFTKLMHALSNFECIVFPMASAQCPDLTEKQFRSLFPNGDTFNPGYGYYLNMVVVGKLVFFPIFNIEEDEQAFKLVKEHFKGFNIVPVDCALLSIEGGLLNCISVQYKL